MTTRFDLPAACATMVRAVQDHASVRKHRRKCRTRRLERTLAAMKLTQA